MHLQRTALAVALVATILSPCVAFGAGYDLYEQGAVALGMAGAATASTNDAAANFYNPAALVRLDGRQFSVGGTWLAVNNSFAGVDPSPGFGVHEAMKTGNFFPPTLYWANPINKRWAYGVGVNSPFGLGVDWQNPSTFTGRARVTKATLNTINGALNLAYAIDDKVSVAFGFDALFADVDLNSVSQAIVPGGGGALIDAANVELKSSFKPGYGYNLATLCTALPDWKFGAYYRSPVHVKITDGDATFKQILTGNPVLDALVAGEVPPKQKVSTVLQFPAIWSLGAAWNPAPAWTYEADFNWTQWKRFDSLDLMFSATPSINQGIVENYGDSFRISVGAEHRLASYSYRFGYYFDQAAAPVQSMTPLLPDANRHGATFGLGFKTGARKAWSIDLFELALFVEDRSTDGKERDNYNGVYKSFINGSGLNVGYHW